ncbi:hypothetical protein DJ480_10800 [Pseudomonas sp. Leaf98]|nr:hypothetical protein DJ480_10800 [Pseudomonas sp. Leaf98]
MAVWFGVAVVAFIIAGNHGLPILPTGRDLQRDAEPGGSWLACDADNSVFQPYRGDAIAGKPAPTVRCVWAMAWC